MTISTQTRRALWARSGNRCALGGELLAPRGAASADITLLGDECHIIARNSGGPRGEVPIADVDGIDNLILLCPTCHRLVDGQPERFTVDRLRAIKEDHERSVEDRPAVATVAARRDALQRAARTSRGRCIERWQTLGVAYATACALADDATVGALPPARRAAGPITVLVGDVGVGKSLAGERHHQAAIAAALDGETAPAPAWLRAADIGEEGLAVAIEAALRPLGQSADHAVELVVDGLDEPGTAAAARLLAEARVLVETRPGSRVLLATRLLAGIGNDDERRTVPPLTPEQTRALIDRITPGAGRRWFALAESLRDATRRPFFAVAAAELLRTGTSFHAPAEVIDRLVRHSIGDRWTTLRAPLIVIALRTIRQDGAAVRPQDALPDHTLNELLTTRLLVEERGRVRFPLILFAQWFAAQGLIDGTVELDAILTDEPRLENWRYPLAIAVAAASCTRADALLTGLTLAQPGFASIVLDAATSQLGASAPDIGDATDAALALQHAGETWVRGLGPLAPLVLPTDDRGAFPEVTISFSDGAIDAFWGQTGAHFTPRGETTWAWTAIRRTLVARLRELLKSHALPVGGSPLEHEAVWDIAQRLVSERISGGLPAADLLASDPDDPITIGPADVATAPFQAALQRHLTDDGLLPDPYPWPRPDDDDPVQIVTYTEAAFRTALDAYGWYAAHLLSGLAPRLLTAALIPARAAGSVAPNDLAWWLEPLEPGAVNAAQFTRFGGGAPSVLVQARQDIALARPAAARWAYAPAQIARRRIVGRSPAATLLYEWLWSDLTRLGLASGTFGDWSYYALPDFRTLAQI